MNKFFSIDLGGTYIKYGLVDEHGTIEKKGKISTLTGCSYIETVNAIAVAAQREIAGQNICGIGIGAPGVVDGEKGIVLTSGNLGWKNKPFAKDLSEALSFPVTLTNDANAAAYGEYLWS